MFFSIKIIANRVFCSSGWFFTPEIIVCCFICYTVLTMYMADNTEMSIRYVHVRLINYTFHPLRDLPHKLPTTCSTQGSRHNQYSNSISNSEIVRGVQIMPRSKHFLFASWGTQIPFTWRNAYWGLWVEPTRSRKVISSFHPCQAFSYGHLGWNLIQLSTGHVSFPFRSILLLQKKTV